MFKTAQNVIIILIMVAIIPAPDFRHWMTLPISCFMFHHHHQYQRHHHHHHQYHHRYLNSFHFRMTPLPSVPWASVGIYDDQRSFTAQHSQFLANHILMSTLIDFIIIIVGRRSNTDFFCKGRGGAQCIG